MDELDVFNKISEIAEAPQLSVFCGEDDALARKIAEHRSWLRSLSRERPNPSNHYRVGVYIRYYNQTKYKDYLSNHKKQFVDALSLCPRWELVDFYIDEGSTAPNMESAPAWSQLLQDCFDGKIDLILTQKISNVSRKPRELALICRLLAAQRHPIGVYFISEDIFTLASYYMEDLRDTYMFPSPDWVVLDDEPQEVRLLSND